MSNIIEDIAAGLLEFCVGVTETEADVRVRDNLANSGAVPVTGPFWESPDIAVRTSDDGMVVDQPAMTGQTNYVYVRVTNDGPASATDVHVNLRAVRFPGTEFTYPGDWAAVDSTHLLPTPILVDFASIGPGGSSVAKFSLSAAQVASLYGWQSGGWHPCLLAEVTSATDYGPTSGVHVWDNNNLAQRNISIIQVAFQALEAEISFPFLYGNDRDRVQTLTLAVDRAALPVDAEVLLDLTDPHHRFDEVVRDEPSRGDLVRFPERSRVEIDSCGSTIDVLIEAGSTVRVGAKASDIGHPVKGVRSATCAGRRLWAVEDRDRGRPSGRKHENRKATSHTCG